MADEIKIKKKPNLLLLKKWKSGYGPSSPQIPPRFDSRTDCPDLFKNHLNLRNEEKSVSDSPRSFLTAGIQDLIQCPLCLGILHNPKMLPCQHTYCLACLVVLVADSKLVSCPICKTKINIQTHTYINDLPSNLYIDSLLQMFNEDHSQLSPTSNKTFESPGSSQFGQVASMPSTPDGMQSVELFAGGIRCSQCQTMCDNPDITSCAHCKKKYCRICWSAHLDDLQIQTVSILKQLDSAANRLDHKLEDFKDRLEHLTEQINLAAEEKINATLEVKQSLLLEATDIQKTGEMSALALKVTLEEAKDVAAKVMKTVHDEDKVSTFINLHRNTLHILSDVSKWDSEVCVLDKESFCIERDVASPCEAESDEALPAEGRGDPLDSEDALLAHYRSRDFIPHYIWRKTSRPCGVGISPWDNLLYICGMDTHCVIVVERTHAKIVSRLTTEAMLCPVHIAFMKSLGQIYVTDKWKHCVHVFSKDGDHLRSFGQKGSKLGMFRSPEGIATDNAAQLLYVVDTGNDRVQVLQPDGKFLDQFGVTTKQQSKHASSIWQTSSATCTELNAPTSIAVTHDRVIILDSGNRRVKVYNKSDKNKIAEFGSLGQRKGQFRQPEVLTADPLGFILVGDSGNSRVQVFKQNGQLVRVFGGLGAEPGKFGWISGICVTKQLDIIISDTKNHCVHFI